MFFTPILYIYTHMQINLSTKALYIYIYKEINPCFVVANKSHEIMGLHVKECGNPNII
jgi:hypothetical protein